MRLSGAQDFDFVALKDTTIAEGKNLEFRWEVYNAFNPANFSGFVNTLTSPTPALRPTRAKCKAQ